MHVRTTLRAALNAAVREGVITDNPASRVELPVRERTHAQVWTEPRVAAWQATGEHPIVAVWTPEQLAAFLHEVRHDGLYALWWLFALRGLRRGEAAGLRWADVDLDNAQLAVTRQRTTAGYTIHEGPPKSATSRRIVALDCSTVQVLRLHRLRQEQHHARRDVAARPYLPSGYVFTRPDGARPPTEGRLSPRDAAHAARPATTAGRAGRPSPTAGSVRHPANPTPRSAAGHRTPPTLSPDPRSIPPRGDEHR